MANCPNCGSEAVEKYCAHCGQQQRPAHTMREFMRAVIDDQFGVDAKFPRTIKALFRKPGLLTREYMDGRISRYIPPFRLYLLASLLFFVLLSFLSRQKDWAGDATRQIGAAVDSANRAIDSIRAAQDTTSDTAKSDIKVGISIGRGRGWMDDVSVNMPWQWLDRKLEQNLEALGKLPPDMAARRFTTTVIEELPKVMFLLLPVFAFLLWILYVRGKRSYLEHFVFALHLHAFAFILFCLVVIVPSPILVGVLVVTIAIYQLFAMKRVYQQGYLKTVTKWLVLGGMYFVVFMLAMVFAVIWALAATNPT